MVSHENWFRANTHKLQWSGAVRPKKLLSCLDMLSRSEKTEKKRENLSCISCVAWYTSVFILSNVIHWSRGHLCRMRQNCTDLRSLCWRTGTKQMAEQIRASILVAIVALHLSLLSRCNYDFSTERANVMRNDLWWGWNLSEQTVTYASLLLRKLQKSSKVVLGPECRRKKNDTIDTGTGSASCSQKGGLKGFVFRKELNRKEKEQHRTEKHLKAPPDSETSSVADSPSYLLPQTDQ